MLVHICCSVDSHYFLQKLRESLPEEKLIGFFYNPNIHPQSEYDLRLADVQKSCQRLGIELIEGAYDYEEWYGLASPLAEEPEKGARCRVCFDRRLEVSAEKAKELGETAFTTTLLTSPKKSLERLEKEGSAVAQTYGLDFYFADFRKGGGTQQQFALVKSEKLYKQDYCGCFFALNQQKDFSADLCLPLSRQILPGSSLWRQKIYEESQMGTGESYKFQTLAYRLDFALLKCENQILPAHVLPYSLMQSRKIRASVEKTVDGCGRLEKGGICLVELEKYNQLGGWTYQNVQELMFQAPGFLEEIQVRNKLFVPYDFSPLLVVDRVEEKKRYELTLQAHTYTEMSEDLPRL